MTKSKHVKKIVNPKQEFYHIRASVETLPLRKDGEWEGRGWWLDGSYKWSIDLDMLGELVLIRREK